MRLMLVLVSALALMLYVMVAVGCAAPAVRVVKAGPIAVKRSFAGCTAERDGRQQCCFASEGRETVCVFTAAPSRRTNRKGL